MIELAAFRRDNFIKQPNKRSRAVAKLITIVEKVVRESGSSQDFDARAWLTIWLLTPNPALNGVPPNDYLDTAEGEVVVAALIEKIQSGAFS